MPKDKQLIGSWLPDELAEKLRDVAYWDRRTLSDIVAHAVQREIATLEDERGATYPPRPFVKEGPDAGETAERHDETGTAVDARS